MRNLKTIFVTILVQPLVLFLGPVASFAAEPISNSVSGIIPASDSALDATTLGSSILSTSSTGGLHPDTASPPIAIQAINPGYTTDAGKNSGELIELIKLTEEDFDLSDISIIYISKPSTAGAEGKATTLYQFPKGSRFIGDSILLRYQSAPEAITEAQDLVYDTSLAMTGSLVITYPDGDTLNSVCWLGGANCLPIFSTTVKSRSYTTIVRDSESGEYFHKDSYTPVYDPLSPGLYLPPESSIPSSDTPIASDDASKTPNESRSLEPQCAGIIFSEIYSYYDEDPSEQFIELFNPTDGNIPLLGCQLRYKNKMYPLVSSAFTLAPSDYYVYLPNPTFRLTKNPNTENTIELIDIDGQAVASVVYPHGQKKLASFALMGYNPDGTEIWELSFALTPGLPNQYQQFKSCPEGKVINEATGNCVKAATVSSAISDCPAGKYRNPATGRCKSLSSSDSSELAPCKEGYERNPETNRCRKVKENSGADYPAVPVTGIEEQSTFIALWAILVAVVLGVAYAIFQFRKEINYFFRKIFSKFRH
ncbi:lamin tail domain-containing protein [Candidatus Saccharibacteria bacterium]|nr:lamin tail domain-containing protein [Candidatus Saccharibacteria bacterium]